MKFASETPRTGEIVANIIIIIMYFYCNIMKYKAPDSGHIAVKFTIMTPLEEVGAKYQCRHLLVSAFLSPLWRLAEHW